MHVHVSKWEFRRGSSIMLGLSSTDKRTNLVCACVCARVSVCVHLTPGLGLVVADILY